MGAILYQFWRSSASWRVRWALAVKRVPFESVIVDLRAKEQYAPEHVARNPMSRVPVLAIDGHHLAESVAIIEYLEERFPNPRLYPADPLERARVRQIVELVNSGVQPLQNTSTYTFHSADEAEQQRWLHHFNLNGVKALEALLSQNDGPFAYGTTFSAADLFVVPQVASARRFGVDISQYPRLARAEKAALATEHATAALPKNQPGAPVERN